MELLLLLLMPLLVGVGALTPSVLARRHETQAALRIAALVPALMQWASGIFLLSAPKSGTESVHFGLAVFVVLAGAYAVSAALLATGMVMAFASGSRFPLRRRVKRA